MPPETLLPLTVVLAAAVTWLATPVAIRLATATGFLDTPIGYKGHRRPTPYLGGVAIMAGVVVAGLAFGDGAGRYAVLGACVLGLFLLGTLDDRINLSPGLRLVFQITAALVLVATGNGWGILGHGAADGLLTVAWVVGVVNAVNLMDNMDGAAATVVGVAAAGTGAVAALGQDYVAAAMCLAVAGACLGFLPHNLAAPARIFMGDGGSMPLGLLLAGLSMGVFSAGGLGLAGIVEAALIAGLVILDTTLVVISRRRAGRPLLAGGRDHLTHRLATRVGSARAVAAILGGTQLVVCAVAIVSGQLNVAAVIVVGTLAVIGALWAIRELERIPVVVVAPDAKPAPVPVLTLAPGFAPAGLDSPAAAFFAEPDPEPEPVVATSDPLRSPVAAHAPASPGARAVLADPVLRFARRRLRGEEHALARFTRRRAASEDAVSPAAGSAR
jgi:UDP-GlcNAc:undecaprenyl-phosphate/decaprenyl-phosphate GlcNAc-1-phosphate transferase